MTRHVVTLAVVMMFAASAPAVLDAQRGGGGARMGGANMGGATFGGGAGGMRGGGAPRGGGGNPAPGGGAGRGGGFRGGGGGFRFQGRLNVPPASPSINRPSFPIDGLNRPAFPLSGPLGIGPSQRSPFDARRGTFTRIRPFGSFGYGGYGVPYAPSYEPESTYEKMYRTPQEPEAITGTLFLDVTPPAALVFLDSAYVGTVIDLQPRGVMLSPGRHWLELEAPGFEKKTIDITVRVGEPLRYRFDMVPVRTAAATIVPERPETMYAIPGCYGGNRPPVAANLPRGCDIAKVRVIRPQPRVN